RMDRLHAISPGPQMPLPQARQKWYEADLESGGNMRTLRNFAACALGLALVVSVASTVVDAQSFQGGLRGMVKDPQGVIPGVTITLINEQTNVSRETTTNAVGEYSFPAVDPSAYTVRAVVAGFKTFERKGFRIGTQQFLTLDVI